MFSLNAAYSGVLVNGLLPAALSGVSSDLAKYSSGVDRYSLLMPRM